MASVFLLQHSYEVDGCGCDETKLIGIYSTREKAEATVSKYKTLKGFCDYPDDCFYIYEVELDENDWQDGFIKWEDAIE